MMEANLIEKYQFEWNSEVMHAMWLFDMHVHNKKTYLLGRWTKYVKKNHELHWNSNLEWPIRSLLLQARL